MDNYIVINGKKAEFTKEQLEKLGINTSNNLWIELRPLPRKSKPRWACPKCGIVIESENQIDKMTIIMFNTERLIVDG